MTDTLRPCPFCGAKSASPNDSQTHVKCQCGAKGPRPDYTGPAHDYLSHAIAAWNRRPTSERDRLRDAVVEAAKVSCEMVRADGENETIRVVRLASLEEALAALAAFESSQKEG